MNFSKPIILLYEDAPLGSSADFIHSSSIDIEVYPYNWLPYFCGIDTPEAPLFGTETYDVALEDAIVLLPAGDIRNTILKQYQERLNCELSYQELKDQEYAYEEPYRKQGLTLYKGSSTQGYEAVSSYPSILAERFIDLSKPNKLNYKLSYFNLKTEDVEVVNLLHWASCTYDEKLELVKAIERLPLKWQRGIMPNKDIHEFMLSQQTLEL